MPMFSGSTYHAGHIQVYTPQTVSFEVTLKKGMSTSKRTMVVELHKHVVTQLMGSSGQERKVNPCREYARMKRKGTEMEVILDDGHGHRRKKYVSFRSAQEALTFEQLITLDNAVGDQLQYIFNLLDKDCSGRISAEDLRLSLTAEGMDASDATVAMMIDSVGDGSDSLHYATFFQLFVGVDGDELRSEKQCLGRWWAAAKKAAKGQEPLDHVAGTTDAKSASNVSFLPGEEVAHIVEHVKYSLNTTEYLGEAYKLVGVMYVTNYRLKIVAYESCLRTRGLHGRAVRGHGAGGSGVPEAVFSELSFPHGATYKVDYKDGARELRVVDRHGRAVKLRFEADAVFVDTLKRCVEDFCFPSVDGLRANTARLEKTFAFSYKLHDAFLMAHAAKGGAEAATPPAREPGAPLPAPTKAFADGASPGVRAMAPEESFHWRQERGREREPRGTADEER